MPNKKRREKMKIIGKIQLIIGILLLIAGVVGLIIDYSIYKNATNQNSDTFERGWADLNSLRDNLSISNDTRFLGAIGYSFYYLEQNSQITLGLASIGLICILAIILSLLFITQGLVNSSLINN